MTRIFACLMLAATLAAADYKAEPADGPPADLAPAIAAQLQKAGHKIIGGDGKVFCEIWLAAELPSGPETGETEVTLNTVPHGALLGALRFPDKGAERRGMVIAAGTYTLRFSYAPVDGAHQGVEPQRDFLILSPAALDQDAAPVAKFEQLMQMSGKASGTPHPASLTMWKAGSEFQPGLAKVGDHDWVLSTKIGDVPLSIVVAGMNTH